MKRGYFLEVRVCVGSSRESAVPMFLLMRLYLAVAAVAGRGALVFEGLVGVYSSSVKSLAWVPVAEGDPLQPFLSLRVCRTFAFCRVHCPRVCDSAAPVGLAVRACGTLVPEPLLTSLCRAYAPDLEFLPISWLSFGMALKKTLGSAWSLCNYMGGKGMYPPIGHPP